MANPYLDIAGLPPDTESVAAPPAPGKATVANANPYLEIAGPDARPAAPRVDQSYAAGLARTALGQGLALGFGDEIAAGARSLIGGEKYDEALADERAKVKQFQEENPGTAIAAEIGGGLLVPGLGIAKPAATMLGRVGQGMKLGGTVGAIHGAGAAEGDMAARGEGAVKGLAFGTATGGALPVATGAVGAGLNKLREAVSPTFARLTGGGAEGAADRIMLNWMRSGGDTPQAFRDQLAKAERSSTFHGGGKSASVTESPLALADLSPTMQKLAGSASRAAPEANARAEAFIGSRQTGLPPRNAGGQAMADEAGIVTRNPLAPLEKNPEPAGQFERVKDAMTRALRVQDKDFHKFGENAYKTEQAMMARLKEESNKLYGEARTASQNFNMNKYIEPIVNKWANGLDSLPIGEANLVRKALKQFTNGNGNLVTSLDGFDKGKRALDGLIGRFQTAGDKNAVRVLSEVKNDLLQAVDAIKTNGIGEKYKAARNYFSSQMEMKEAIDLGRNAFREDANVVADQFRALTEGQKKLFRMGMLESFENTAGRSKRTADITQMFENPKTQALLREVIPRSPKADAVYRDRPERFGEFLANAKAMIDTRNKVLGGSPTQGRGMDDAMLTRQIIGDMFQKYRQSPSLFAIGMEAMGNAMNKVFGFRQDTAEALARRLFTAKPAERDAILARLEAKFGTDRLAQAMKAVEQARLIASNAASSKAGADYGRREQQ